MLWLSSAVMASAVWPGRMSADSLAQLAQAEGLQPVRNWHAGTLVALWRPFFPVGLRPGVVLFSTVFVCHLAVACFARLRMSRFASAWAAAVVCWFPPVLGYLVVLSRDTWFAVAHLAAAAALLRWTTTPVPRYRRWWVVAAVVAAEVAVLARQNAVLGSAVLLGVALTTTVDRRWRPSRYRVGSLVALAAGATVAVAVAFMVVNRALSSMLGVQESRPQQAPMVLDLAVLSVRNGELLLPESVYPLQDEELLDDRLDPFATASIVFGDDPLVPFPVAEDAYDDLRAAWREALLDHPFDYLGARFALLMRQIGVSWHTVWVSHPGIDANSLGYDTANPWLDDRVSAMVGWFTVGKGPAQGTWPTRPVLYLVLAGLSVGAVVWQRRRLDRRTVVVLGGVALSGVTYLVGVFLGATTVNYRFAYPVVLIGAAVTVAAVGVLWSAWSARPLLSSVNRPAPRRVPPEQRTGPRPPRPRPVADRPDGPGAVRRPRPDRPRPDRAAPGTPRSGRRRPAEPARPATHDGARTRPVGDPMPRAGARPAPGAASSGRARP